MFRLSISRLFRFSIPSKCYQEQRPRPYQFNRRKPEDQFGLLSAGLVPPPERYDNRRLDDRFIRGKIVTKAAHRPPKPALKQITLPSTMRSKKRKSLEKDHASMQAYQSGLYMKNVVKRDDSIVVKEDRISAEANDSHRSSDNGDSRRRKAAPKEEEAND